MEKLRYGSRCDECEKERHKLWICVDCVETLCFECNSRVHNKGTRVRHRRYRAHELFYEDKKQYPPFQVLYFSPECYRAIFINSKDDDMRDVAEKTFEIVWRNTRQGFPMTYFEDLIPDLTSALNLSELRVEALLDVIIKKEKLFTFTTRKFGNSKIEKYLSLALKTISVEALSWIIMSIKNDKMQPSQSLIHSRIKEFFDIKIGQKEWKKFIETLHGKNVRNMNYYRKEIPEIRVNRMGDDLILFDFANEDPWGYLDFSPVDEKDNDYKLFLEYIDDFFSESAETGNSRDTSNSVSSNQDTLLSRVKKKNERLSNPEESFKNKTKEHKKLNSHPDLIEKEPFFFKSKHEVSEENIYKPNQNYRGSKERQCHSECVKDNKSTHSGNSESEIRIWLRSVERPLDNSRSGSSQSELTAEKQLLNRGHSRAIPGGKYGCALMIKRCGPELLKKKSLGRILALIKKSLEQGVLNHYRTLLVKNKNKTNIDSKELQQKIYEYSRNVIELLKENRNGISLAQFKQNYKNKFPGQNPDIEELQFSKLSDFLNSMKYVVIEKRDRNNNFAILAKDVNPRKAIAHYNHLLKSLYSQKKLKNGPPEEYEFTKELIQRRRMDNRTLMGHETNIYLPPANDQTIQRHEFQNSSLEFSKSKEFLLIQILFHFLWKNLY